MSPDARTAAKEGAEVRRLRPRGSSQGGLRQYNERVVLQAIRLHGALPGAEIARVTHLTAQTVSLITKRLLEDGLLLKGTPQRGKVGQPSVPLALDPDGAFAVGVKIGRRSIDVLLVDFVGTVRQRWSRSYRYPEAGALLAFIDECLAELRSTLPEAWLPRVQGLGIAIPFSLGGWRTLLDMPPEVGEAWQAIDFAAEVQRLSDWPVTLMKDTAAACVAELVAGRGRSISSFLYVFLATFVGGGLVLDSHLRSGLHGNAGAIGSMPLGLPAAGQASPAQLLSEASLLQLEQRFAQAGLALEAAGDERALQAPWWPITSAWLASTGAAIALAINSAACLLDIENVIIDGSIPAALRDALRQATEQALDRYDWQGVTRPQLLPGTIGSDARALGGALLPLHANFAPDRALFLKAEGG
ncbi:ROK family transcriptional regulator [Ideonella alba]|uniref:ROK family transcriptional regulator n=1 Tax=Ideonella alba TaxID=2824118 RepID=UPI001FFD7A38|nr:ROK family transcriptional regulator [Ideonella alba]